MGDVSPAAPASIREAPNTPKKQPKPPQKWTDEENRRLIDAVAKLGKVPWSRVAESMDGRAGAACRDHYCRVLRHSEKYSDAISAASRRASAAPDVFELLAAELPIDPLDPIESIDQFSFDGLCELGAMPHLAQPMTPPNPSPATLAALPTFGFLPKQSTLDFRVVRKTRVVNRHTGGLKAKIGSFGERVDYQKINRHVNRPVQPRKPPPRPPMKPSMWPKSAPVLAKAVMAVNAVVVRPVG